MTRRDFAKVSGALFVSLQFSGAADTPHSTDPALLASWLEIRADHTILARTGRTETGTGMSAFYAQMIAEELHVDPGSISLLMGDTDRTPDGGYSAGFLSGAANVRKVAAYTYQALLAMAATQLGVPAASLTVSGGIVSSGGKSVSYGDLVKGRHLDLKIPVSGTPAKVDPSKSNGLAGLDGFVVDGNPPLTPVSRYRVIGTSFPMPGTPDKVTGKTIWSCDVVLPGMLHARMVRPSTLGSTLVAAGAVDKRRFPGADLIRKGNLLAVVSSNEWEAVSAARAVAAATKWTEWRGLPESTNLTAALRAQAWAAPERKGNAADVGAAMAAAPKTISATYEQPYVRHAPLGPFVSVADVRTDGATTVYTHSSNSQGLRAQVAHLLSTPVDQVVVRWLEHAGQYGRTTFGGDGADADAVILSQATGKPVRVQWTMEEDLAWSTVSPGWVADFRGALNAEGRLTAMHCATYMPHQNDARLIGAILAGMPCSSPRAGGWVATEWPYDKIQNRLEQAYSMPNLGADGISGGLRGNIMRTPGQRQQNFALEGLMNEAASAAGADPIEFRLRHTTDQRLIDILHATAQAAGWEARTSPGPGARTTGTVTGRGMCLIVRSNAYWVGIAEVSVAPATGVVRVEKFTIGVECGKIINPRQLDRCMKSGLAMGLSEALKEEVTFDSGKVTSTDWSRYKILTMEEMPEVKVVQLSRDDKGFGTGGEAANAVGPPAVAAAFFDATGVAARRIPLTPEYVLSLLRKASPPAA